MRRIIAALVAGFFFVSAAVAQIGPPPGGGGSGVTSVAAGCGTTTSPAPIVATGTVAAAMTTRANTATTDTILSTDCGNRVTENNASAVADTLPQAGTTGFGSGFFFDIVNLGAGTVTITPTTSTINGSATLTLAQGQGASISSDGTNYSANLGKGGGSGTVTTTGSPASGNLSKFSGSSSITNGDLSGDCSTNGTLAVTCPNLLPQYPYGSTSNYFTPIGGILGGTLVIAANRLYMIPVYLPTGYPATNIAISVATGQSGGSGYLGLYSACLSTTWAGCSTAAFGQPNALLASGGTSPVALATSSQTPTQAITFTTTYSGLYYLAVVATASGTTPSITTYAGSAALGTGMTAGAATTASCLFRAFTFPTGVGLNASEVGNAFVNAGAGATCPALGIR